PVRREVLAWSVVSVNRRCRRPRDGSGVDTGGGAAVEVETSGHDRPTGWLAVPAPAHFTLPTGVTNQVAVRIGDLVQQGLGDRRAVGGWVAVGRNGDGVHHRGGAVEQQRASPADCLVGRRVAGARPGTSSVTGTGG